MNPGTQRLAILMQVALVAAFGFALGGAFIPGVVGRVSGAICLALLISAPILRVLWLTVAWACDGDRRFAAFGAVLLAVLAVGSALAFLK
jgi:hypothetical protein